MRSRPYDLIHAYLLENSEDNKLKLQIYIENNESIILWDTDIVKKAKNIIGDNNIYQEEKEKLLKYLEEESNKKKVQEEKENERKEKERIERERVAEYERYIAEREENERLDTEEKKRIKQQGITGYKGQSSKNDFYIVYYDANKDILMELGPFDRRLAEQKFDNIISYAKAMFNWYGIKWENIQVEKYKGRELKRAIDMYTILKGNL